MCETIRAGAELIIGEIGGRPNKKTLARARRRTPFGNAPPNNVYAYLEDETSPWVAELLSRVTGSLLPRLLADVHTARATPPELTNTDGDPLCLIKARLRLGDAARIADRLAEHPDIEVDPDDDARLIWFGREVPPGRQAAMLAEARAQLRARGHHDTDIADADRPQRWVRGQLHLHGDELRVEVNSHQRLDGLLTLLDELGARPTVIDRSQVDPTQDLPWSAGHRPLGGGLAPAEEGWERHWLDESVPALRGRTPRQVAASDDWPLLEGLLRQLEHDADVLAQNGKRGADTVWLREQLAMSADLFA